MNHNTLTLMLITLIIIISQTVMVSVSSIDLSVVPSNHTSFRSLQYACGGPIDLTPLNALPDFALPLSVGTLYFSPCRVVRWTTCANDITATSSTLCWVNSNLAYLVTDNKYGDGRWSSNNGRPFMSSSSGERAGCGFNRKATVEFVCNSDAVLPVAAVISATAAACDVSLTVSWAGVCDVPTVPDDHRNNDDGLSGGSVFLIIFFVSLFVYCAAGAVINHYMFKRSGTELIPNLTFWMDLPHLLKDGCVFTGMKAQAMIRGDSGGSKGGSSSSGSRNEYETFS